MGKFKVKFTPGPWECSNDFEIIDAHGFPIASVHSICIKSGWQQLGITHWVEAPDRAYIERSDDEVRANQKLISAAPEMYEALKKVLEVYDPDPAVVPIRKILRKAGGE
ncbi:MAG: hypothetical protein ACPL5F_01620 [Moorellaceae bacterium]